MSPKDRNEWIKLIVGVFALPAVISAIALIALFSRVSAVERGLETKPDSATISVLHDDINQLRGDIRELRTVLLHGR